MIFKEKILIPFDRSDFERKDFDTEPEIWLAAVKPLVPVQREAHRQELGEEPYDQLTKTQLQHGNPE